MRISDITVEHDVKASRDANITRRLKSQARMHTSDIVFSARARQAASVATRLPVQTNHAFSVAHNRAHTAFTMPAQEATPEREIAREARVELAELARKMLLALFIMRRGC